ncbi:hypothetical protein CVT26_013539 [Gymnopilus dilepis]|uniref:Uncharacterized protein n=1 Tax=Gymnopilus dilepis TaxID=231916 RepID=A0A409Y5N4_9AGAR|nr:hypothetical protein CVT26_013539 [Gymnopilus dilepis]
MQSQSLFATITDEPVSRGRTQIAAGSRTVLGIIAQEIHSDGVIGPGRLVNQITGKLRLL